MTALRDCILARQAVVRERMKVAEAATPGPWRYIMYEGWHIEECGEGDSLAYMADLDNSEPDAAHIAANSPATVIAECRRELAGIDADLALDDFITDGAHEWSPWVADILANLEDRYPEGDEA